MAMMRKILTYFERGKRTGNAAIPSGHRTYLIGDIHGRADLLDILLEKIGCDCAVRPHAVIGLVFLGDYINRGPQSAVVLGRLAALAGSDVPARFLMGNHEEILCRLLDGEEELWPFFLKMGGDATLESYGVNVEGDAAKGLAALQNALPLHHRSFLDSLEDMVVLGDYAFVHAGVRPGVPLALQLPSSLRWIRQEFLDHDEPFEKVIVHGHTISDDVVETETRIGIDTGAYKSDRLTCLVLEEDRRWVIQADMASL